MNASQQLWDTLRHSRLIALLSPPDAEACLRAYEALHPLGVALEIALRTDAALDGLAAIRSRYPDALLLTGTVLTKQQAEQAIAAGAAGVVSPDYFPPVVEVCVAHDVMCVPGGLGDVGKQLVQKAELLGCAPEELKRRYPYQWVHKLFPAMSAGPAPLDQAQAWKAIYEDLTIIYTGGVTLDNLREIARRDPTGIVCASALTKCVEDADALKAEAQRWLERIHGPRSAPAPRPRAPAPQGRATGTVVTFGEIMLRLAAPPGRRLGQASSFEATFGGAEANVAVSLAQFGLPSRFVTAVPDNPLGQTAINTLRGFGVDTTHTVRQGRRLGVYYLEHGAAQRAGQVVYDRAGSAASELGPGQVDWEAAFQGASWFHWTGITPALSNATTQAAREALQAAKRAGATVSVDLNYRAKLWSPDQARAVLTPLMEHVDIVIGNEEDAAQVFDLHARGVDPSTGRIDAAAYRAVAEQLIARFGFHLVAITLRESISASDNRWSACLHDGTEFHQSRTYDIRVVDRVGAGDAFAAGLIHGLLLGKPAKEALEFAVAASCLKHSIHGDFNLVSVAEVERLLAGDAAGRVRR